MSLWTGEAAPRNEMITMLSMIMSGNVLRVSPDIWYVYTPPPFNIPCFNFKFIPVIRRKICVCINKQRKYTLKYHKESFKKAWIKRNRTIFGPTKFTHVSSRTRSFRKRTTLRELIQMMISSIRSIKNLIYIHNILTLFV